MEYRVATWTTGPVSSTFWSQFRIGVDLAVNAINENNSFGFNMTHIPIQFPASMEPIDSFSGYVQAQNNSVIGLIGPTSTDMTEIAAGIFSYHHLPLISLATSGIIGVRYPNSYSSLFRIQATDDFSGMVFLSLFRYYGFDRVAVIFDNSRYGIDGTTSLRQVQSESDELSDITLLNYIWTENSKHFVMERLLLDHHFVFLVFADAFNTQNILRSAISNGMVEEGTAWFCSRTCDQLQDDIKTHVSGLVMLSSGGYSTTSEAYINLQGRWLRDFPSFYPPNGGLPIHALQCYDSVFAYAHAIRDFTAVQPLTPPLPDSSSWAQGPEFISALQNVSFKGLSNSVEFSDRNLLIGPFTYGIHNLILGGDQKASWEQRMLVVASDVTRNVTSMETQLPIMWPGNTFTVPTNNLFGDNYTAYVSLFAPHVMRAADGTWTGIAIDILNELAKQYQFTINYIEYCSDFFCQQTENQEFCTSSNGGCPIGSDAMVSFIGGSSGNVFGARSFLWTSYRRRLADASSPYSTLSLDIALLRPQEFRYEELLWAFLTPFRADVWWCLFAVAIVSVIALYVFETAANKDSWSEEVIRAGSAGVAQCVFTVAMMILGVGEFADKPWRSAASKLLLFCVKLVSLVTLSAYTAALASVLIAAINVETPVSDWSDLYELKVGILSGGPTPLFAAAKLPGKDFYYYPTQDESLDALLRGEIDAVVGSDKILNYYITHNASYCDLMMADLAIFPTPTVFAFPLGTTTRDPAIIDAFNRQIQLMVDPLGTTTIQALMDYYYESGRACFASASSSSSQLTLGQFGGIFIFFAAVLFGFAVPYFFIFDKGSVEATVSTLRRATVDLQRRDVNTIALTDLSARENKSKPVPP